MPIRRFLYLLIDDHHGAHTLRKIDTAPFFAAGVCAAHQGSVSPAAMRPTPLPPPAARFESSLGNAITEFLPLGRGVEKVVGIKEQRDTIICDTRTATVRAGPALHRDKMRMPSWVEFTGKLYLLGCPGMVGPPWFDLEALTYDPRREEDGFWDPLPSPPTDDWDARILSFADAGDEDGSGAAAMRVSTRLGGTYAFDAARRCWRWEGEWVLPFYGRAQFVADYGLWFGFSDSDRGGFGMRAADLGDGATPEERHLWPDVDGLAAHADDWFPGPNCISYLGCGRFCVTRFLTSTRDFQHVALATLAAGSKDLHMVRKASTCYHFSQPASLGWTF
nr:unnamed protein product [Digitaria exilis]